MAVVEAKCLFPEIFSQSGSHHVLEFEKRCDDSSESPQLEDLADACLDVADLVGHFGQKVGDSLGECCFYGEGSCQRYALAGVPEGSEKARKTREILAVCRGDVNDYIPLSLNVKGGLP